MKRSNILLGAVMGVVGTIALIKAKEQVEQWELEVEEDMERQEDESLSEDEMTEFDEELEEEIAYVVTKEKDTGIMRLHPFPTLEEE